MKIDTITEDSMFKEVDLVKMMKGVPHFSPLPPRSLISILRAGSMITMKAGEAIFWEGDPCSGLFVLLRGVVHLVKTGPGGQRNIMAVLSPVTMFNEVAVLDGGENPATAMVFEDGVLWWCSLDIFQEMMEKIPHLALGLLPIMARRNRLLIQQYEDICFLPVRGRMAKLLLEMSENGETEIDRSVHTIDELSSRISTSPEVVSRTLGLLTAEGYIQADRRTIEVLEPKSLVQLWKVLPF
jgi:CRP/FNR family cyclic AMP-dependent transcriptional regulator